MRPATLDARSIPEIIRIHSSVVEVQKLEVEEKAAEMGLVACTACSNVTCCQLTEWQNAHTQLPSILRN